MKKNLIKFIGFVCWLPYGLNAQLADSAYVLQKAREHLQVLCSDTMQGRGYLFNGHLIAANYIQEQFETYGLKSVCPEGYLQTFSFPLNIIISTNLHQKKRRLIPSKDYLPSPDIFSIKKEQVKPVLIGYGLPSDWNKLKKPLKAYHWVVIKDGLPADISSTVHDSLKKWKELKNQISLARAKGARGLIILKKKLTHGFSSELGDFPVIYLQEETPLKPMVLNLQSEMMMQRSQNVVGFQQGLSDSVVVLCAHYDHLGRLGEAIFYGANDNASGIAFLLTLAEQMKNQTPKYSLLWIAFGAEETGLNGSIYYALKSPCLPLDKIKCVLNFDLMGNGQEGVMAVGGQTYPFLHEQILSAQKRAGTSIPFSTRPNAPNSDHYPFTLKNIPALFFYTMGGAPHYHDIFDRPEGLELPIFVSLQKVIYAFLND